MSPSDDSSLHKQLSSLFDAEKEVRRQHLSLLQAERSSLLKLLAEEIASCHKEPFEEESNIRLVRIAAILGDCSGSKVVDSLIDILGSPSPEARLAAGNALTEMAFDRFKEVALGVERAIARLPIGNEALAEMPFMLIEIPEPGVAKLLKQFLAHKDAEAVAATIEACVEWGEPSMFDELKHLREDQREVEIDDDDGNIETISLGELAKEACEALQNDLT
jgi:hypothetical protein